MADDDTVYGVVVVKIDVVICIVVLGLSVV